MWPGWYLAVTASAHKARHNQNSTLETKSMSFMGYRIRVSLLSLAVALGAALLHAAENSSQVTIRELRGESLTHSLIGTNPVRKLAVYLPPSYSGSAQRCPVIYYLPSPLGEFRPDFYQRDARGVLDHAIASHAINEVIFVAVDMATPLGCSWYLNSPVTGNWEDFMIREVVRYVDANFRTLSSRDSRGIAGDYMGGYGAIRFGMTHPKVFGSVYALHPGGTGFGLLPMYSRPNWETLANATSLDDVRKGGFNQIFTTIYQAHLPDVNRPPLYIDLPARKSGDTYVVDAAATQRMRESFFLEAMIPQYAENLKSLRGFKFDWDRNDEIQDHVHANQAFTHMLNEYGIPHEAEEYNGFWNEDKWSPDGRVLTDLLPFFQQHLVFPLPANH
jgi:enterochelin esterase-like enzyme